MNQKVNLIWLRNDLRLHDNEALYKACKESDLQIPLYIIDPRWFEETDLGFRKTGAHRVAFLLQSLSDLRRSMQRIGGDLLVRVGLPEEIIPNFIQSYGIQKVYSSKEVTSEETLVERAVEKVCMRQGVEVNFYWQSTLFHLDDLPFVVPKLPDIFTEFRKACEKFSKVRACFPSPNTMSLPEGLQSGPIPSIAALGFSQPIREEKTAMPFRGGETEALERLDYYLWESDLITTYKETRNEMLGTDYSSKFSVWLALGCLSPRNIYREVKKFETEIRKNDSTYWLIFELIWRDYFRFVARKFGNALFHEGGLRKEPVRWKKDVANFIKWREGRTGIPFIDANMRELAATGFMSNRGRQLVASFLTKDLKIHWHWGAAWFEHCLIDYDPCSNYGNWAYVAGVGNDPREDRYFNILSQAKRYDPNGAFVRCWLPEIAHLQGFKAHRPDLYAGLGVKYPAPIINPDKWERN